MKSKRKILEIFFLTFFLATWAFLSVGCVGGISPPEEEWNRTFGGANADEALSVQQTVDGGYILAGYTNSPDAGWYDFLLVKTDSDGNKQWDRTFGDVNFEQAFSVQQTADGGYILAGYTNSYGAGDVDFWLVKTDENGNELWNRTFGGPDKELASSVQQTSDGGYIIAGQRRYPA